MPRNGGSQPLYADDSDAEEQETPRPQRITKKRLSDVHDVSFADSPPRQPLKSRNINDDTAEKRRRRKSTKITIIDNAQAGPSNEASSGDLAETSRTARQKQPLNSVAAPIVEPGAGLEILSSNFDEWMKMATDNKINAGNSWNFALIDYFHDMSLLRNDDGNSINFQRASCTLDGCVKIWTSRVDSVTTETGKLLSNLANDGKDEDDDGNGSDNPDEEATAKKKKSHRPAATLAKDPAQLRSKKLELEFSVDPLFKKTCADFDEGGAQGLLMNHLSLGTGSEAGLRVIFDASDSVGKVDDEEDLDEPEEAIDLTELRSQFLPDLSIVEDKEIAPSLADFSFSQSAGTIDETTFFQDNTHHFDNEDDDDDNNGGPADYGMNPDADAPPAEEDFFTGAEAVNEDFVGDYTGDDFGGSNGSNGCGLAGEQEAGMHRGPGGTMPFDPRRPPHDLVMAMGDADGEGGIMDYFDKTLTKNGAWAGPEHWKMRKTIRRLDAETSAKQAAKPRREKKEAVRLDFTTPADKDLDELTKELFAPATGKGAGINLPGTGPAARKTKKKGKEKEKKDDHSLPDDMHFTSRQLVSLFLKPKYQLKVGGRNVRYNEDGDGEVDENFWAQAAADQAAGNDDDDATGGGGAIPFNTQFFHDDEYDGPGFDDDDGDGGGPGIDIEPGEQDLLAATQGKTRRVKPEFVNYAKRAKRVDVRKLKDNIWKGLDIVVPPSKEEDSSMDVDADERSPTDPSDGRVFGSVISGLQRSYPKEKMEEISTSFCFICLLHLANEQGLKLETGDEPAEPMEEDVQAKKIGNIWDLKTSMDDGEAGGEDPSNSSTTGSTNVRRSLSLLGKKLPNLDFASLIRSSSLTVRRRVSSNPGTPSAVRRSEKLNLTKDMLQELANDVKARPTKADGILNLISPSRSRSASRSKAGDEAEAEPTVDVPVLPANAQDAKADPNGPHKPPELLQSRPISGATTNTASTVTPTKVTPRKRAAPPSRIPLPVKEEPSAATLASHSPEAKQSAKKNFSLFGIPLPSPRKSSHGSRPNTPSTKNPSPSPAGKKSASPHRAGAASPTPSSAKFAKSKPKPAIGEGLPSSSKLDNFSKFFVGTGMRVSVSNPERPPPTSPTTRSGTTTSHASSSKLPTPRNSTTTSHKPTAGAHISPSTPGPSRYMRVHEPVTPTPASRIQSGSSMSSIGASTARPRVLSGTASAVNAPSTPRVRSSVSNPRGSVVGQRTSTTGSTLPVPAQRVRVNSMGALQSGPRASAATTTTSTSSLSTRERRPSIDSSHGYQTSTTSAAAPSMTATAPGLKSSISAGTGRKHGSFDFERPGWSSRGGGSSLGVGSRTRRDREPIRTASVDGRQERSTGSGMAGVGAARLYASTSAAHRTVRVVPPPPTPPEKIEPNHTGASTSTSASHSNVTGATSSWGRSTGKRLSAGLTKLTNGLGLGKSSSKGGASTGKERQHGKFSFEPPVPSLPIGIRREVSGGSERSRERDRSQLETDDRLKPPQSPKGHSASLSTSSTSSTHTGVSRSLDLGLGLAWAPTKVRENAVMPESSFGRSLSASRREQQGKEVAEVFRNALDEDGYRSFKKYVHRFDAHEIPFDGPTGIVTRVERLLRKANHLPDDARRDLLDSFVKLILQNA
ncbi:condensin complex subunit 2 [Favolaschia claudopus]|uniref:Condensin complex subunit 2 n=1 Tax=Favolaschia claudopus TaxID=2862362 RepID=A0AAW0BYQ5_9AGAR